MKALPVRTAAQIRQFHSLPRALYGSLPHWIEPPHADIEKFFRAAKNAGTDAYFGENGGIGFFESTEDFRVAELLIRTAESWLIGQGVSTVYGPIHPEEKDIYWGLLIDGFEQAPAFRKSYHRPYYRSYWEALGYSVDYLQYAYRRSLQHGVSQKMKDRLSILGDRMKLEYRSAREIPAAVYKEHILEVYNEAWGKVPGFRTLDARQIDGMFRRMKPIMDPDLIWLAYRKGKPVAFVVYLPEIGPFTSGFKGNFHLLNQLRLAISIRLGRFERITGVAFGVHPSCHGRGVAQALIAHSGEFIRDRKRAAELELNWIGDFNDRMIALVESFGAERAKTFATFKKRLAHA